MSCNEDYQNTLNQDLPKNCWFCKYGTKSDISGYTRCKKYNKIVSIFQKMEDCKGFKKRSDTE